MDSTQLLALVASGQYALVAALFIGFGVRILKSDTKIPIDIPPAGRKYAALALAAGAAVLEKYALHADWKKAALDGVVAWVFAEWGHKIVIEDLRKGKELPIPGLMIPGAAPGPGKPPSTNPPPLPPLSVLALFVSALVLAGCAKFFRALDLAADKAACVVQHQDLSNEMIVVKCALQPGDFERYADLLAESRRSASKAVVADRAAFAAERAAIASTRVDAGACASDAGLPPCDAGACR